MRHELSFDRLNQLSAGVYLMMGLLALRFVDLQVIRHSYYAKAAERNRTQTIIQTAPRGRVFDRTGNLLATNRPAFSLVFLPSLTKNQTYLSRLAKDMAPYLKKTDEELLRELQVAFETGSPVRLAENLPPKTMFNLAELRTLYPGVDLVVEARRYYPYGSLASHLIGYLGSIDSKTWLRLRDRGEYRKDSRIGKAGLEKLFERELRGRDGGILLEVDAHGKLQGILQQMDWKPGMDIALTIDSKLQRAAEEALRASHSRTGAVVVLDPQTGAILAMASVPDFDPNLFMIPQDEEVSARLKSLPEFNLAAQGTFPPGSIFKIVVAAAGFNEQKIFSAEKFFCPGYFQLGPRTFLCWDKKGHKLLDFLPGFAHSCDVYFYQFGLKTGADLIEQYERKFHLGMLTMGSNRKEDERFSLPGEKKGLISGPGERARRKAHGGDWYQGDTVNLSIGQGELLVTPIQMASLISTVANGGSIWKPQFVEKVISQDGHDIYQRKPELSGTVNLKPETWDLLHQALIQVVQDGTARSGHVSGIKIGGKTGTAQNPHGEDHAWFVAYAGLPGKPPSLALSVLVEHGGHGATAAVPIAKKIIEVALKPNDRPPEGSLPKEVPPKNGEQE
ncbi:MAG: penicillin-binding protein 2 [Elusimicrobia bacterium]|nr:penicillin-binding protein 2 [Elusimicrobiota bacterium]